MKFDLDLQKIDSIEFGVGRDDRVDAPFVAAPIDPSVRGALIEMVTATMDAMLRNNEKPESYSPSEKYTSTEYLIFPLGDTLGVTETEPTASMLLNLHSNRDSFTNDADALKNPDKIYCYFVKLRDNQGKVLTAVRRSTYFKGILKKKILRMDDDALRIVDDDLFKLDIDFDLLIDSENFHIWRPSSFESLGALQEEILNSVQANIQQIGQEVSFIDFDPILAYASTRPRAARYIASIKNQQLQNIDKEKLINYCNKTGVHVFTKNGLICINQSSEMDFLEVLDRRRFEIDLSSGEAELFRAASRKLISR